METIFLLSVNPRPARGSSRSRTFGLEEIATAISNCRNSPYESSLADLFSLPERPTRSSCSDACLFATFLFMGNVGNHLFWILDEKIPKRRFSKRVNPLNIFVIW